MEKSFHVNNIFLQWFSNIEYIYAFMVLIRLYSTFNQCHGFVIRFFNNTQVMSKNMKLVGPDGVEHADSSLWRVNF